MPEYGRHVQKMLEQVCEIEDKEKRTQQAQAVVNVMSTLNPHLKEYPDYKHKLWDHAHIISGYKLDVDGPYEAPVKEEHESRTLSATQQNRYESPATAAIYRI